MYEFLALRVEDAMSHPPRTIAPTATLREAERIFEEHGFNGLPVVDASGELVGLFTKLDLLRAFRFGEERIVPPYEEIMQRPVSELLTEVETATVAPETPLTRVLEQLVRTRFKSFVVARDGRPIGMISREDVMKALRRAASTQPAGPRP